MTYEITGGYPADDPEMQKDGFEGCYELLRENGYPDFDPTETENCAGCPIQEICPMFQDYLKTQNEYGLPEDLKPDTPLVGCDKNIFAVMGTAGKALRRAGFKDEAAELMQRITITAKSYDEALQIILRYINPV